MLKEFALSLDDIFYFRSNLPNTKQLRCIAEYFNVFSDPTRIEILTALAMGEFCVTDLCDILELNQTTISHQLKILRDANIVDYRRQGKILFYRIINPYIDDLMNIGVNHMQSSGHDYNYSETT